MYFSRIRPSITHGNDDDNNKKKKINITVRPEMGLSFAASGFYCVCMCVIHRIITIVIIILITTTVR